MKNKKQRKGKVINTFSVEIVDSGSDPTLDFNPNNPFTQLSEEERLKDFIQMFSLLWAESCLENSKKFDDEK